VAFVLSRINDIIKPPPARQLQSIRGGLGIVIDDVFASLYTLAMNHALVYAMGLWAARAA
jgi:phosphatidylglycerophosphatase A